MSVIGDSSMMISNDRFRTQEKILKSGRFFKFICGAGNEDPEEVYKLSLVYTLAGAKSIDISATVEVVQSTIRAINDAEKLLDHGIYVIAFSYPVVSKGLARIRTQMSAAHTFEQIDKAIEAFTVVGKELGIIK